MLCKELTDTKGNIRSGRYIELHLSVCITYPLLRESSGNFKDVSGEIVALNFEEETYSTKSTKSI